MTNPERCDNCKHAKQEAAAVLCQAHYLRGSPKSLTPAWLFLLTSAKRQCDLFERGKWKHLDK